MSKVDIDEVLKIATPFIRVYEGLRLKPYLCSAKVPTIGYGSTRYLNGVKVTLKDPPISKETAEIMLRDSLKTTYLPSVLSLCPTLETPHQVAAILSWVYNLGAANLQSSTLRKKILRKLWAEVPKELMKWVFAAGVKSRGLENRRKAEVILFNSSQRQTLK